MQFLKKYRKEVVILALIIIAYFSLRLPNLTLQPIFADEAIYVRWAQVMRAEPTLRFLPLSDGKTPLFMWALMPLFKIFEDPLFAGRFLSIISGFGTLLGVLFLGWKFFDKKVGIWAAFLIAIVPYFVFFDRLALVDSMLSVFSIWSLNIALLLVNFPRVDLAMILGYFMGGSLLTKPPGFFNVLALPVTLALFNFRDKQRQFKFLRLFGLWVIAVVITLGLYNILRLGPGFSNLNSRNQDYVFSPTELTGRPLDPFIPHLRDLGDWFPKLLTIPVLILVLFGVALILFKLIFALLKRKDDKIMRNGLAIILWALIPLVVQMAFLKVFTARYILFSLPAFMVIASFGLVFLLDQLKLKKYLVIFIAFLLLLPQTIVFDYHLLTNPEKANLPKNERRGYLEDWTAGYGLKEIALFLSERSKLGQVIVGTEGSFGTLPDGLQIYLDKNRQVVVIGGKATISAQLRDAAKSNDTYFVANRSRYKFFAEGLELIKEYPKATCEGERDAILLFKVLPLEVATTSAKLK